MIKIIKPGTRTEATCKFCGCVFSYEKEDIKTENILFKDGGLITSLLESVNCPQCNKKIEVKTVKSPDMTHHRSIDRPPFLRDVECEPIDRSKYDMHSIEVNHGGSL